MIVVLLQIMWINLILFVWFESDAFLEYANLIKPLRDMFKIKEYFEYKNRYDQSLHYHSYLRLFYNNFFIRLITCPICSSFWLSIISTLLFCDIIYLPIVYLGSYCLYKILKNYFYSL